MKKTLTFYSIIFMGFLILQRVAGFLTKIIMANSITPYEYGVITLVAITIPAMLQIVTNLNFYQILSHSEHGKKYFGFSLVFSLILVIFSSLMLILFNESFFSYLNLPVNQSGFFLTVIIISMFCVSITIDFQGVFTGMKLYSLPGIIMTIPSIVRLLIVWILMYVGVTSVTVYILVFSLSNAIPLIYIAISRHSRDLLETVTTFQIPSKKMFGFGVSIFIVANIAIIGQYLIRIVISHDLGIEWQGMYDVSQTLAMIMIFALGTMTFIAVPEATNSDENALHAKEGLGDVTRGLFALVVFLALILFFYSKFLVITIFSADYEPAAEFVYILAIGYIFFFIQNFLSHVNLSYAKRGREYIALTIIPLCLLPFFFFLTGYLIQFFKMAGYGNGFIGAYVSFTILIIIFTVLTIIGCKDLTPVKVLFKRIDRLVISLALPSILVFYIQFSPFVGIFLFTCLCGILIFTTGYLQKELILNIFKQKDD
jgi:O-antigen/teichoic acid export membrane protein